MIFLIFVPLYELCPFFPWLLLSSLLITVFRNLRCLCVVFFVFTLLAFYWACYPCGLDPMARLQEPLFCHDGVPHKPTFRNTECYGLCTVWGYMLWINYCWGSAVPGELSPSQLVTMASPGSLPEQPRLLPVVPPPTEECQSWAAHPASWLSSPGLWQSEIHSN